MKKHVEEKWTVCKSFKFEMAHVLEKAYSVECMRIHGHSYRLDVYITCDNLTSDGMLLDFKKVAEIVKLVVIDRLDHRCIEYLSGVICDVAIPQKENSPTAENMAKAIYKALYPRIGNGLLDKVRLWETDTCWAEYSQKETEK